jgi:Rad3-related DNA helicase
MLMDKGCALTYVSMTARDKLCVLPERVCSPLACPMADGHFDRVNDALWALLERAERITRNEIDLAATEFNVCPYELMLDASLFADIIICDYNYVFDPTVSLKRFFGETVTDKYIFLIDEAHNLVERAREMFSATINKSDFDPLRKILKGRGKKNRLGMTLNAITAEIKSLAAAIPEGRDAAVADEPPRELQELLLSFRDLMDEWLAANAGSDGFNDCMETHFRVLDFLRVYDGLDKRYTVYTERRKADAEVTLMCLDPSANLAETLKKAVGSVFFSATLTPITYFKNVLGGGNDDKTARLPSPFNRDHLCVVIENRISTKYIHRTPASYAATADALYGMVSARKGNYFAFFSSYAYLENVLTEFIAKYPEERVHVQERLMGEPEREAFLAEFKEDPENGMLAFAVMGGVFSEGVDLVGERLIGAAVVGVGLPQVSLKREALMNYYNRTLSGGFEYAYMYPGMNKVLQAAGRVLRTETDRGAILLIDTRFSDSRYIDLFPYEWLLYKKPLRNEGIGDIYKSFWDNE